MGKLRLGVIGAGAWAVVSHLPNLDRRKEEVEFVGVSRKGAESLQRIKERFGFEVASEDYRDVIDADIDICVVSSPGALHFEHAKAALESGASVLVEKPFTVSPSDGWQLVELAAEHGLHVVCSFGYNFMPLLREAKDLYDEVGIGNVEQVAIRMFSYTRELLSNTGAYPRAAADTQPEQRTWTDSSLSGGGYGQAQLSHALGAALWITGLRGSEVYAAMSAPLDAPVELHDSIVLAFEGGAIGTMTGGSSHVDVGSPEAELDVHVLGSEGQFSLEAARGSIFLGCRSGPVRIELGEAGGVYNCDGPPNTLVDLALGREVRNCAPGELGARTVEILDAAYRSAAIGRSVSVAATTVAH